jgi:hypothetical protein
MFFSMVVVVLGSSPSPIENAPTEVTRTVPSLELQMSGVAEWGSASRSQHVALGDSEAQEEAGLLGVEIRGYRGLHGAFGSVSTMQALWGPQATLLELGYSIRPVHIVGAHKLGLAVTFQAAPVLAFVGRADPVPSHTALGGKVGTTVQLQWGPAILGLDAGYRVVAPIDAPPNGNPGAEQALFAGLTLGFGFEHAIR